MARKIKRVMKKVASLRYAKLNAVKFALAFAIVFGIGFAIGGLFPVIGIYKPVEIMLSFIYGPFGYSPGIFGAILVGVYAFLDTFVGMWIIAKLYNMLL